MVLQANQISVRELLEMIFRNKWLFIGCVVAGFCLSAILGHRMVKYYMSEAQILVDDRQSADPIIQGLGVSTSVQQIFNTVSAKILSVESLRRMSLELGLGAEGLEGDDLLQHIRSIRDSISMKVSLGIISIRCERTDPYRARDIVDYLCRALIRENLEIREDQIVGALDLLKGLLTQYNQNLIDAEMVIKEFDEINQVELTGETASILQEVAGIEQQVAGPRSLIGRLLQMVSRQTDNEIELKALREKRGELQRQLNAEPEFNVVERTSAPSEVLRELESRRAQAIADLAQQMLHSSDQHPLVLEKRAQVERYEQLIAEANEQVTVQERRSANPVLGQLRIQVSELDSRIRALETEQSELKAQTADLSDRVKAIPAKELEKSRLQREQVINSQMYQHIRMRYESAILTNQLEQADRATRFTMLNAPSLELKPIRPHMVMVWAMGTFLGMVMGICLSFIREFTDTSFRNLDDASRFLDLPVLGVIPEVSRRAARSYRRRRSSHLTETQEV